MTRTFRTSGSVSTEILFLSWFLLFVKWHFVRLYFCLVKTEKQVSEPVKTLVVRHLGSGFRIRHLELQGVGQHRVVDDGLLPGGVVGFGQSRSIEPLRWNVLQWTSVTWNREPTSSNKTSVQRPLCETHPEDWKISFINRTKAQTQIGFQLETTAK